VQLTTLLLILGVILAIAGGLIWLVLHRDAQAEAEKPKDEDYTKMAEDDVEHIFNDEFREELRNRGRLHFEKIISENAMFLQQDLRLTTSQLNDFMKQEITRTLQEEFSKYERSITDAKQLAIDSINKTQEAIEQQRQILGEQLEKQVAAEKARLVAGFEKNMADIVNHYVLAAIGNQIDLNDQLEYIIGELQTNKDAILEDIKNGS
jgi:hypothetical protein